MWIIEELRTGILHGPFSDPAAAATYGTQVMMGGWAIKRLVKPVSQEWGESLGGSPDQMKTALPPRPEPGIKE